VSLHVSAPCNKLLLINAFVNVQFCILAYGEKLTKRSLPKDSR
jgi:hypothetical protein